MDRGITYVRVVRSDEAQGLEENIMKAIGALPETARVVDIKLSSCVDDLMIYRTAMILATDMLDEAGS